MCVGGVRGGSDTYFVRGFEKRRHRIWLRVAQVKSRPSSKTHHQERPSVHIHGSTDAFNPGRIRGVDVRKRSTRADSRYRSVRCSWRQEVVSSCRSRSDLGSSESCWDLEKLERLRELDPSRMSWSGKNTGDEERGGDARVVGGRIEGLFADRSLRQIRTAKDFWGGSEINSNVH